MGGSRTDVDVIVVGAGAVAGAAAWHLARAGRDVLLLSRPEPGPAAAGVTVPSRTGVGGPAVELADGSVPLWREVEAETGACLLSLTGAVDHGSTTRTAELARALSAHGHRVQWLSADDAGARWPGMHFTGPVLHQPDRTGRVYAAQAARALRAAAVGRGATTRSDVRVRGVGAGGAGVAVRTGQGTLHARRAVLVSSPAAAELPAGEPVSGPWRGLWTVGEQTAGFRPLGVHPCMVQERDWPVFVRHGEPGERWPETVYGAPDPCGDVIVGFSGPAGPVRRLRGYVAAQLPGLDAVGPVSEAPVPGPPVAPSISLAGPWVGICVGCEIK